MAFQRPVWTFCLIFVWLLILPGIVLTHNALEKLIPFIKLLPVNIVKGFDETFKFAYLDSDAQNVKAAASDALSKCGVTANPNCNYVTDSTTQNTKVEKDKIVASFSSSLAIVQKVANDKYFGVDDLKETADSLNQIKTKMDSAQDTMACYESNPLFCNIYNAADGITTGMAAVTKAVDSFSDNPLVKQWNQYAQYLIGLHAFPWIMVIGMLCFMVFWYKGGKCCPAGLCLIPFVLLWLLDFVIYLIICAAGSVVKYGADRIMVPMLKGKPTLDQAISHFQTAFPEFWDLVFANMVEGLDLLLTASYFFVAVAIIIAFYSLFMCCCCPYEKQTKSGGSTSCTAPVSEMVARRFIEALRAEYVEGKGAAVGGFFDGIGTEDAGVLNPFEDRIRESGDKNQSINELASKWGLDTAV